MNLSQFKNIIFLNNLTRYYFQQKLQTDKMRKHMDQNHPPAPENDTAHPWRHMVDTRSVISVAAMKRQKKK